MYIILVVVHWKLFKDTCFSNLPAIQLAIYYYICLYLAKKWVSKFGDAIGFFIHLPVSFPCIGFYPDKYYDINQDLDEGEWSAVYCVTIYGDTFPPKSCFVGVAQIHFHPCHLYLTSTRRPTSPTNHATCRRLCDCLPRAPYI